MKLLFCLNRDIQSNFCLNLLLPLLKEDYQIRVILGKGFKKKLDCHEMYRLRLLEQELVNDIIFPEMEKNNSSNKFLSFNQLAIKHNFIIQEMDNINLSENLTQVKTYQPDLIISIRNCTIFQNELIKIPKQGVLNLHSGILPTYRGVLTTFRALLNDDKTIGTTLHFIDDKGIDTGRIINHSYFEVNKSKSLFWHLIQIYYEGIQILVATINEIKNNKTFKAISQSNAQGNYFSFPTAKEVIEFKNKGWKILDEEDYLEFMQNYCSLDNAIFTKAEKLIYENNI